MPAQYRDECQPFYLRKTMDQVVDLAESAMITKARKNFSLAADCPHNDPYKISALIYGWIDHKCDEMQGFYFSKPIPENEFAELLRSGKALRRFPE